MEYKSGDSSLNEGLMGKVFTVDTAAERELKKANLYYILKFLVAAIFCFIFFNTGSTWIGKIIKTLYTSNIDINISLVARTTLALAVWFVFHSIICVCNPNLTDSWQFIFHTSFLWAHTLIFIGMWIGCWFIPDGLFNFYLSAAKYISFFYLLIQIFFLMDWFFSLNDKFYDENNIKCIASLTVLFSVAALTGFGLEYYFFCLKGCDLETAIVSVNLVLCIFIFLASMFIERGSIFTASLVACYVAYLTSAGCMCHAGTCTRISQNAANITFRVLSSLFTLAWMTYSAFSATLSFDACSCSDEEDQNKPKFSLSFFHGIYALAAVYLTMIVTSWATTGSGEETVAWATDKGKIARWVNWSAAWVTIGLYMLVLIMPYICPNREFD